MKSLSNYSQPSFYNFTEDSLELAKFATSFSFKNNALGLDLCAGCGVVGIEVLSRLEVPGKMTFLELQKDFISHLKKNIQLVGVIDVEVVQNSIGEQHFSPQSFDFILSNPPYFNSGEGRTSPDIKRQISRTFEVDSWDILLKKSFEWLKPKGYLFVSTRSMNPIKKYEDKFKVLKKEVLSGCSLVALSRLDID